LHIVYAAITGALLFAALYWVVKEAVAAGVESAIDSYSERAQRLIETGVARGIELDRKCVEFSEEND
jgi:hypothetical protein